MKKLHLILLAIAAIVVIFMASTLASPVLIVCEDMGEDGSIDMAATFSLAGFEWIYPGSSFGYTEIGIVRDHFSSKYKVKIGDIVKIEKVN